MISKNRIQYKDCVGNVEKPASSLQKIAFKFVWIGLLSANFVWCNASSSSDLDLLISVIAINTTLKGIGCESERSVQHWNNLNVCVCGTGPCRTWPKTALFKIDFAFEVKFLAQKLIFHFQSHFQDSPSFRSKLLCFTISSVIKKAQKSFWKA